MPDFRQLRRFLPAPFRSPHLLAGLFAALLLLPAWHSGRALVRIWPAPEHPLLVGYFPQWGLYQDHPYRVKDLILNGGAKMLDQINYAQGFVTNRRCSVADPNADLGTAWTAENSVSGVADNPKSSFRGYFHQLRELKRRYPHLKILISLEGKASSFAEDARPENRRAFVASCIDTFLRGNFETGIHEPGLFDGFDIDWESPQQEDAANFQALLVEFRRQMQAVMPESRLSVAVGPSPQMLPGTDFRAVAQVVDEVGVMNYDYTGPWSGRTGFLAPLFSRTGPEFHEGSIATSMASYQESGVPKRKLLMGLPFYGYSWTAVNKVNDGLFQNGKGVHDDRPWSYIRTLEGQFTVHRDPVSHAAWLFDGQTFWTCDDPVSVRYKASYAKRIRLGGVMVWELSEDTDDAQLLHIAHRSLRHPMPKRVFAESEIARAQSVVDTGAGEAAVDPAGAER